MKLGIILQQLFYRKEADGIFSTVASSCGDLMKSSTGFHSMQRTDLLKGF